MITLFIILITFSVCFNIYQAIQYVRLRKIVSIFNNMNLYDFKNISLSDYRIIKNILDTI